MSTNRRKQQARPRGARQRAERQARRERAAELFAQGRSQAEVARELDVSRQSASRWHAGWQAAGATGLQSRGPTGRQPKIPDSALAGIEQALLEGALTLPVTAPECWTLGPFTPATTREASWVNTCVGIDLHRRRSVIVRLTSEGEVLETVRVDNDPVALWLELAKAGPHLEVVLEATYGWYWAADLLQTCGARVHLAHPLGSRCSATSGPETDASDSRNLVELLGHGSAAP